MAFKLLIGTDPEFFLCKDGNVIPPIWFKKQGIRKPIVEDEKHPVYFQTKDVRIIQDGVAFEVNTTPSTSPKEFLSKINLAKDILGDFAEKTKHKLVIKSTVGFNPTKFYTGTEDEEVRQCVIFGCDPDKDAFNQAFKAYEFDVSKFKYRFGGGHLHISGHPLFEEYPIPAIKLLAIICGNYYVANSKMIESDRIRARYYGKAGKYREQRYKNGVFGLEYRSLPNYWTTDLNMIENIFNLIDKVVNYLENPAKGVEIIKNFSDKTMHSMSKITPRISQSILKEVV